MELKPRSVLWHWVFPAEKLKVRVRVGCKACPDADVLFFYAHGRPGVRVSISNRQAAGQRTLAPFCSPYGWLITRIGAIRLKRSVTKTAYDVNIAYSGNKHAQLTNCSIEVISFSMLIGNNANSAINLQQLRNNMYYHSSPGAPAGFQARVGKKIFPFAHPGFQFAHPAIRNGCPPCPPYRGGFKGKGLVGH